MLITLTFLALMLLTTKIVKNEIETRARKAEARKTEGLLSSLETELARIGKLQKKAEKNGLNFFAAASSLTDKLASLRNQVRHGAIAYGSLNRDLETLRIRINHQESLMNEQIARATVKSSSNAFICDYSKVSRAY